MNNTSALVHVEKLYKEFTNGPERLRIIDGISLSIEPGSILVITGSSGSGKSTLLNILGGLERPSSGEIHSCGYILTNAKEEDLNIYRSHSVGFVFQFHHLLKDFNALENVLLPAYMAGKGKNKAQEEAKVLLEDVGLANRMDHYPSQLSGGERQRVALARALINRPELILADEPTGNLDEANSQKVEEILFSLVKKYGKTLIFVTHDKSAIKYADTNLRLHAGTLENP